MIPVIQNIGSFYDYVKSKALQYADSESFEFIKRRAREWAQMVVNLHNLQVPESLKSEKNRLLSSAKTIKNAIEKVIGVVPELSNTGLGLLPLIPIAVIAGAATMIASWISDYMTLMSKVDEQKRLEAKGLSPPEASKIVNANYGDAPLFGIDLSKWLVPGLMVGAGLWFLMGRRK